MARLEEMCPAQAGRVMMYLMLRGDCLRVLNELGAAEGNEGSIKFGERRSETRPVRR